MWEIILKYLHTPVLSLTLVFTCGGNNPGTDEGKYGGLSKKKGDGLKTIGELSLKLVVDEVIFKLVGKVGFKSLFCCIVLYNYIIIFLIYLVFIYINMENGRTTKALIFFFGIFIILKYLVFNDQNLVYLKSKIDEDFHLVQDLPNKKAAADMMAEIKDRIELLINYLRKTYPRDPRVLRLFKKCKFLWFCKGYLHRHR